MGRPQAPKLTTRRAMKLLVDQTEETLVRRAISSTGALKKQGELSRIGHTAGGTYSLMSMRAGSSRRRVAPSRAQNAIDMPLKPRSLRAATTADTSLLVRHRRAMWEEMGIGTSASLAEHDALYRRWIRPRLRNGSLVAWVVEDRAGRALASGCLWIQRIHPRPGNPRCLQPYLMSMYTEPDARGRGHARRIVRAAIAHARRLGLPRMALHASDAGRPVYEREGFKPSGEMHLRLPPRTPRR